MGSNADVHSPCSLTEGDLTPLSGGWTCPTRSAVDRGTTSSEHPALHVSNHFDLGFTKEVYGMLYDLLVYHQYSLVNEIGPPHKGHTFCLK